MCRTALIEAYPLARAAARGTLSRSRWLILANPNPSAVSAASSRKAGSSKTRGVNAILPNVISYHPFAGIMTLRRRPGLITIYPAR